MPYNSSGRYYGGYTETMGLERDTWYSDSEVPEAYTTKAWRAYDWSLAYESGDRIFDEVNHAAILEAIVASGARRSSWHEGTSWLFVKVGTLADSALRECEETLADYPCLNDDALSEKEMDYAVETIVDEARYGLDVAITEDEAHAVVRIYEEMWNDYPSEAVYGAWWPSNDEEKFALALQLAGVELEPEDDTPEYPYISPMQEPLPGMPASYGWQVPAPAIAHMTDWGGWEAVRT